MMNAVYQRYSDQALQDDVRGHFRGQAEGPRRQEIRAVCSFFSNYIPTMQRFTALKPSFPSFMTDPISYAVL